MPGNKLQVLLFTFVRSHTSHTLLHRQLHNLARCRQKNRKTPTQQGSGNQNSNQGLNEIGRQRELCGKKVHGKMEQGGYKDIQREIVRKSGLEIRRRQEELKIMGFKG